MGPKSTPGDPPRTPQKWPKWPKMAVLAVLGRKSRDPDDLEFRHFSGRIFLNQAARTPKNVTKEH